MRAWTCRRRSSARSASSPRAAHAELLRRAGRAAATPSRADDSRRRSSSARRRYHPDRYFKKELGPYAASSLNEIYKRIVAAHDVLRDPKLRAAPTTARSTPDHRRARAATARRRRPRSRARPSPGARGSSLRSRLGPAVAGAHARLAAAPARAEPRARERSSSRRRMLQKDGGDWARAGAAASSSRSPSTRARRTYHDELAERPAARERGARCRVRRKAEMLLDGRSRRRPPSCSRKPRSSRPTDAELAFKLARAALFTIGASSEKAALYAERGGRARGRERPRSGSAPARSIARPATRQKARKHLQRAWELDPMDKEIRQALQTL